MPSSRPKPSLSAFDAICIVIGVVVGVGIFRAPSVVAANVSSETGFLLVWLAGALISLVGALCYAELAISHPDVGGEYHFLSRAYGRSLGFLFAWGRLSVIQTGAIATVAFVFGDYFSELVPLGPHGPSVHAATAVAVLTSLNLSGVSQSKRLQNGLTVATLAAIAVMVGVGLAIPSSVSEQAVTAGESPGGTAGALGLAMIFVLLTFGGWNEAAYLSAEVKDTRKNMVRVLVVGITIIGLIYLLMNYAYLNVLGLEGMRGSDVVAADLLRNTIGGRAALILSAMISVATLTTLNATIFTGARSGYALGRDFALFGRIGKWNHERRVPGRALLVQGGVALVLIGLGATTREGFTTMVEYTAPVFWLFFLLSAFSLFILRRREPEGRRPFSVPFYPITPALFCLTCAYMLHSSLAYTGVGALVGMMVLLTGVPLLLWSRSIDSRNRVKSEAESLVSRIRRAAGE